MYGIAMFPVVVAQLQKYGGQPNRSHHDHSQRTEKGAALGINHNQTESAAKEGGGNYSPAARIGFSLRHEECFLAFIQGFGGSFKRCIASAPFQLPPTTDLRIIIGAAPSTRYPLRPTPLAWHRRGSLRKA